MKELIVPYRWRGLDLPKEETSPGALESHITPLVYALNRIGLSTRASCEGKYKFKTAEPPFVDYIVADKTIEDRLKEAIRTGGFSWSIEDLNMPIPIHELSAEITINSPECVKSARVESVELAQHLLKYFGLLPQESKAFEMFEAYKHKLKKMPL